MINILKYIWQLPQNIVAEIYYYHLLCNEQILCFGEYKDAKLYTKSSSGSVTLGNHIFASCRVSDNTLKHEYGHTKQSLILGPLYLIIIGLPSILWAATHNTIAPNKNYSWFFTEAWADKLGK